jgi:hypothetical protein
MLRKGAKLVSDLKKGGVRDLIENAKRVAALVQQQQDTPALAPEGQQVARAGDSYDEAVLMRSRAFDTNVLFLKDALFGALAEYMFESLDWEFGRWAVRLHLASALWLAVNADADVRGDRGMLWASLAGTITAVADLYVLQKLVYLATEGCSWKYDVDAQLRETCYKAGTTSSVCFIAVVFAFAASTLHGGRKLIATLPTDRGCQRWVALVLFWASTSIDTAWGVAFIPAAIAGLAMTVVFCVSEFTPTGSRAVSAVAFSIACLAEMTAACLFFFQNLPAASTLLCCASRVVPLFAACLMSHAAASSGSRLPPPDPPS